MTRRNVRTRKTARPVIWDGSGAPPDFSPEDFDYRDQLERPEVVSDPALLRQAAAEIDAAQDEVDRLYARWAELEAKRA